MENNLLYSDYSLVVTEDGSHSIRFSAVDEGYHSVHGATSEAVHVYLLPNFATQAAQKSVLHVFEMGFGTGLNALLTYMFAHAMGCKVYYTAVEAYPVPYSVYSQLNYPVSCANILGDMLHDVCFDNLQHSFEQMHTSAWGAPVDISDHFVLLKHHSLLHDVDLTPNSFDVVYYDAFAPQYQPELWTPEMFEKIYSAVAADAILTTYCCKGDVKRALKAANFKIEKLPGPKGKREMLRAMPIGK
ncbi:MAG: tRNA (5-methylaminomethyl-2-thiouridine)(34)-methyltransferase MnmD [Bacteroidales bacterium]|nr:tRNA (5-methylaminomethyl-2-thiouridine)(34)-methyltransferase MnmD [Bacteroidales bacterium]